MRCFAVVACAAAWLGTAGAASAQDFSFYMDSGFGGGIYSEPLPEIEPYDTGAAYDQPFPSAGAEPYCHHKRRKHQPGLAYGYGEAPPVPYEAVPNPGYYDGQPDYGTAPYDQAYIDEGQDEVYEPAPRKRRAGRCVPGELVQKRLTKQGWSSFRDPVQGPQLVALTARRPDGLTYRLSLDRCTGVIVSAYLVETKKRRKHISYKDDTSGQGGSPAY